jgi:hypothetical protein
VPTFSLRGSVGNGWRVKVGQAHSEFLVDLKGLPRYSPPPAVGWSGIAPDGLALSTRDLSTDEIYALDLDVAVASD